MPVSEIPDDQLLERAVRSARDWTQPKRYPHQRWVAVMRCFSLGSTYSHELCRRFGRWNW